MYTQDNTVIHLGFLWLQMPGGQDPHPNSPGLARHLLDDQWGKQVLHEAPNLLTPPTVNLTICSLEIHLLCFFFAIFSGNGYIEGKELENFQELEKARERLWHGVKPSPLSLCLEFSVILNMALSIICPRSCIPSAALTSLVLTLRVFFYLEGFLKLI